MSRKWSGTTWNFITWPVVRRSANGVGGSVRAPNGSVLKVSHHGSRYQELRTSLRARLALVSVGTGNSYGHPAEESVDLLRRSGIVVRRTDASGDIAVVVREGQLVRELSTSPTR